MRRTFVRTSNPSFCRRLDFTTLRPLKRSWSTHFRGESCVLFPAKNPSSKLSERLGKPEILKLDKSCISNPKSQIGPVQPEISDFGFEMQDLSNFKISGLPAYPPLVPLT